MSRKRYEVRGMMEWHTEFRIGRGRLRVSFTGGHLCGGACTPASFTTDDPVVQKVIESSEAFRSGLIRLAHTTPSPKAAPPAGSCNPCSVMEFADIDSAADFLQHKKGISIDRVLTREQCVAEAKSLGIELVIRK